MVTLVESLEDPIAQVISRLNSWIVSTHLVVFPQVMQMFALGSKVIRKIEMPFKVILDPLLPTG